MPGGGTTVKLGGRVAPTVARKYRSLVRRVIRVIELVVVGVVAIPAVWFYNFLTSRIEYFNVEMDNSSSELVDYFIKKTAA